MLADYLVKECELIEYHGEHFFINDYYEEIAAVIRSRLENL